MKLFVWIAATLSVFAAVAVPATAQVKEALKIEDLLGGQEFGQMSEPALSPDQQLLVYSARRKPTANSPTITAVSSLFMYLREVDLFSVNIQTLETKCITCGMGNNGAPVWSPDGQYLAFLSEQDGSSVPNLWVWDRSTNAIHRVSKVEVFSFELQWRNNTEIVCRIRTEAVLPPRSPRPAHSAPAATSDSEKPSVAVFHSTPAASSQSSPPWNLDGYTSDLATIDVQSGKLTRLTKGSRVATFAVSPDGAHIAFSSPLKFERPGSQQIRWDLIVLSLPTNQQRTLASDIRLEYDGSPFSWSPDSSKLAYLAGGPLESRDPSGHGDCFIIDSKTGKIANVTNFTSTPAAWKQRAPLWNEQGSTLYFLRNHTFWKLVEGHAPEELAKIEGHRILELAGTNQARIWSADGASATILTYDELTKQSGFYRVDLQTGKTTKLREEGCFNCINVDDHVYVAPHGDKIVYFYEDAAREPNLWLADSSFITSQRLTHLNPQLDQYQFGKSQLVKWRTLDGLQLQGALLLPPDYQPNRSYPLVLWAYSGSPGSDYLNRFGIASGGPFNMQLLATRGYAVLYPDIPENIGASMIGIAKAVLPAVNQLIDAGVADPDWLGVVGQSFGGYTSLALATQSRRFKAAVDIDGFSNLITAYGHLEANGNSFGVAWSENGQAQMGGSPWDVRDKYIENSPYFYLDKLDTPLLIVHGTNDATVPPFLADELFVALRRLGKEVEYARYVGENHSAIYWKYPNQVDFCRRLVSFLGRRLRGTEGSAEGDGLTK
jgi:dipeptidyl aminopeptidase/acylaminoacyl peptidase